MCWPARSVARAQVVDSGGVTAFSSPITVTVRSRRQFDGGEF